MLPGRVSDAMSREVFAVAPDTSLAAVARLLSERHFSGAPVVDPQGRPVGLISQSDLLDPEHQGSLRPGSSVYYRITAHRRESFGDTAPAGSGIVADLMSPYRLAIEADAPLMEAVQKMVNSGVHRILALNGSALVGILTSMDVMRVAIMPGTSGSMAASGDRP